MLERSKTKIATSSWGRVKSEALNGSRGIRNLHCLSYSGQTDALNADRLCCDDLTAGAASNASLASRYSPGVAKVALVGFSVLDDSTLI